MHLSGFSQASAVNGDSLFFPICNESPSNMCSLAQDRACAYMNSEEIVLESVTCENSESSNPLGPARRTETAHDQ